MYQYGTQYYRYPTPPKDCWDRDLAQIRRCGFTVVKVWANWANIHRSDSVFDFSDLQELIDTAHTNGLLVIVNVILENAPYWLIAEHPHTKYVTSNGFVIHPQARGNTPGGGWPGLCPDNEEVSDRMASFLRACVRNLTGKNVYAFDIWNETHQEAYQYFSPRVDPGLICFCDASKNRYVEWLKTRYQTIDNLNSSWLRHYSDWDQVYPPHQRGSYPDLLDWQRFRVSNMTDQLRWRYRVCKDEAPDMKLISHIGVLNTPAIFQNDSAGMATIVDEWGVSTFGSYDRDGNITNDILYRMDCTRSDSRGKVFWQSELQGGPNTGGNAHIALRRSAAIHSETIKGWNWIDLMCGAKGIMFWQYRPEMFGPESTGNGLTDRSGNMTERLSAAAWFAHFVTSNPVLSQSVPVKSDIAVLNLYESEMMAYLLDDKVNWHKRAMEGAHEALSHLNFSIDVIRVDRIENYSTVYIPFPLMVEQSSAEKIRLYIEQGGSVITEGCFAHFTDNGYCSEVIPGHGLDTSFGLKESSVDYYSPYEADSQAASPPAIAVPGGIELEACIYRSNLEPTTSRTLFTFDDSLPAVTVNSYGQGQVTYIATFPSISQQTESHDGSSLAFFAALFQTLSIRPSVISSSRHIRARVHEYRSKHYLYCVNVRRQTSEAQISLPTELCQCDRTVSLVYGECAPIVSGQLHVRMAPCGGDIFELVHDL